MIILTQMLKDIKRNRIKKLKNLIKLGLDAYPAISNRSHSILDVKENFSALGGEIKKVEITLAGRIFAIREHGGSLFLDIEDGSAKIQAYIKKDEVGDKNYKIFLENFDLGDFIETKGTLFLTRKGEKTILVKSFQILAKTLLPLPEQWHGLQDIEERYRKRYLDLLINKGVKAKFELRARIIQEIRKILELEKFLEVETPILQPIPGGAMAEPFKTHHRALNLNLYLRIAPELYLKRLLVGGLERVFEIGKNFRNEGIDYSHNPEFTMLEFYAAYKDYNWLMDFTEKMFQSLIKNIFGRLDVEYEGNKITFLGKWPRYSFKDLIKKITGLDYDKVTKTVLEKKAKSLGIKIGRALNKGKVADEIFKKLIAPNFVQPTFVINHPIEISPLAKLSERFQLIVGGLEMANAYSELNDPEEQKSRLKKQPRQGVARYDADFIEALEYGMPPAAGFGMGIDRLTMLLTNSHSVKEVILFPTLKPKNVRH